MSKVKATRLPIEGALLVEPPVFRDDRGWFKECWNAASYDFPEMPVQWVQDNVAWSRQGVLRGLHFQDPFPQAKLVGVPVGEVFDVIADIRPGSPTAGHWFGERLSAENGRLLLIPAGCAHGYVVLSDQALFAYKCSALYHPSGDRSIRWDDPELGIQWPHSEPMVSEKDRNAMTWREWRQIQSGEARDPV